MSAVLEVRGLTKRYKDFCLDGVSFSLEEGFIMGFIGPNGAGKTTTIKAILNQVIRDSGEIRLWGLDNIRHETDLKARIGVVEDEGHYYGHLTLRAMKNLIAPFYKNWREDLFARYMRLFDLDESKKIRDLSKGMRVKFSLAVALSHEADLLIMDEPTSGLDPLVRADLLDILRAAVEDGRRSVFFSTHITSDLDKVADYIVFIDGGRIVLNEPKDELLESHAVVKGPKDLLSPDAEPLFVGVQRNGFGFSALTRDKKAVRSRFGDRVQFEKPTVEDIMLYYARKGSLHAELD